MIDGRKETVGDLLHDAAHLLRMVIDRQAVPHNLTRAQWHALAILDGDSGLTQVELAERLELGNPAAGRLIDRLEERGFVERRSDPADRRVKRVYIKAAARPKLVELEAVGEEVRKLALKGLSREEHRLLVALLKTVKENLSAARAKLSVLGVGGVTQFEIVLPFMV